MTYLLVPISGVFYPVPLGRLGTRKPDAPTADDGPEPSSGPSSAPPRRGESPAPHRGRASDN